MGNEQQTNNQSAFDELEAMFSEPTNELENLEKTILSEDLEGFASCFPDWDLHPPKRT